MDDITREQFEAYLDVRDGGETNMWNAKRVIELAQEYSGVELTRQEVTTIIDNFEELQGKFGI